MNNREIIRRRVMPKGPSIRAYKTFTLFAKILRIGNYGIQVSKARTNSRFWVDIARYQADHNDSLLNDFKVGDEVELTVSFNTYINRFNEHTLKIHLVDISKADAVETYPFEFKEQEFTFDGRLLEYIKTDLQNVYLLKLARLDEFDQEMETYDIRYYSPESVPKLDTYEVTFMIKNTPNILNIDGEAFTHEEQYETEIDGKTEVKTNRIFVPCLEIRGLYYQPRETKE